MLKFMRDHLSSGLYLIGVYDGNILVNQQKLILQ